MTIYNKLAEVQKHLVAGKDKYNKFGGYNYRSAESILESVKPLLHDRKLTLIISDEIINVNNRVYIKATTTIIDQETGDQISVNALAREPESKKGMDEMQITGATSSYARKYALSGLFNIDDNKDADTDEYHEISNVKNNNRTNTPKEDNKPSTAQLKALYNEAIDMGMDKESFQNLVNFTTGKTSLTELTFIDLKKVKDGIKGIKL